MSSAMNPTLLRPKNPIYQWVQICRQTRYRPCHLVVQISAVMNSGIGIEDRCPFAFTTILQRVSNV